MKKFELSRYYNFLIYWLINPEINRALKIYAKGILVDIGCGEKPYREFSSPFVDKHIGVDHPSTKHSKSNIDIFSSAYEIPIDAETIDTVLCTDVLEHLEEPYKAIAEAGRLLKQSGIAIYTVPFFWHIHEEPRDFFRYSKFGLQNLFEKNGFDIIEIKPLSGFIVMAVQEFCYYVIRFRKGGLINPLWWIIPPMVVALQVIAFALNKIDRSTDFTIEYLLIAQKKK